ncbi:hypothetical protein R1flu_021887 [Riccia fluitans]|uniref:Glycosyltransferase n=1 Tax=Riccia fluitans TaxID=41844 RepID=A0ABD1ZQP6_9MARC
MSSLATSPRALLVPIQTQGHWSPFMQIMRHLMDNKVAMTLCVCQDRADEMKKYVANGDFENADIEVVVVFSHPKTYPLSPESALVSTTELQTKLAEMKPERFSCVISDFLLWGCQVVANELWIPYYGFIPCAAHFSLAVLNAETLAKGGWFDNPETDDRPLDAPGLEIFAMKDLNWRAEWKEMFSLRSKQLRTVTRLIINTFEELEQNSLDTMRILLENDGTNGKVPCKIFTIGPVMLFPTLPSFEITVQETGGKYLEWLDKKPKSSVVFICFGSYAEVGPSAGMAVAKALESTEVPFLWALRLPPETRKEDVLPEGFEARTQGRGLIVTSWVSQQDVLLHPSIGAFLSHCGWNSFMESISAGVPILAHPLFADQHMNARHMVSTLKVAIEIKHEKEHRNGEYTWEAVAEGIRTLMVKEEGEHIRHNMLKLQQAALKAVAEGGSSHRSFQELSDDIKQFRQP